MVIRIIFYVSNVFLSRNPNPPKEIIFIVTILPQVGVRDRDKAKVIAGEQYSRNEPAGQEGYTKPLTVASFSPTYPQPEFRLHFMNIIKATETQLKAGGGSW